MKKNSLPTVHVNNQTGMIEVDGKVNIVVTSKWYSLKGCDHIVGATDIGSTAGSFVQISRVLEKPKVYPACLQYKFEFCPDCGEKLNLKKDE